MIIADTSAVVALIDADDRNHETLLAAYSQNPDAWRLPWAILPEVDYLLAKHVDSRAEIAFVRDIAEARYTVEWDSVADLVRARQISDRYQSLLLGLVDTVVMAMAERLGADAIVTLDVRHFGAVKLRGTPKLWPRDL